VDCSGGLQLVNQLSPFQLNENEWSVEFKEIDTAFKLFVFESFQ